MPTIPENNRLSATSVDILNAIRNSASANYQNYVPIANNSQDSIREIGAVIMDYPVLQNEFLSALVNRIGRVMLTSKMYDNPWAIFKKGLLEFGETIEEIFVNIAEPFTYDVEESENKVFARNIPDVRSAFHVLNYQKYYKATIQNEQLRQAFLSWTGITELIARIVDSMYAGSNYDEFLTMKYLLARHILNGELHAVTIPTVQESNMKSIISTVKGVSNNLEFMSPKYNLAGVSTYSLKEDQYFIVDSNFDATMDVEVLASAFNMDKADFIGHRVLIDSFSNLDNDRLDQLFSSESWYVTLTEGELSALSAIPAVLVDRNWFMIFDNLYNFTEQYNGQGLYWNYWYHTWKTFSVSPFSNAVVFVPGRPTITSVTVSPESVTVSSGQTVLLSANVETQNFASKAVNWSISPEVEGVSISPLGLLNIPASVNNVTLTVTATSVVDKTKSDYATITVGSGTTISTVTVSPSTATADPGDSVQFTATVTGTDYAPNTVTWSLSPETTGFAISNSGLLTIADTVSEDATITVTATSTFDNTKSGTATVTVDVV